jgi:hypothetical protein
LKNKFIIQHPSAEPARGLRYALDKPLKIKFRLCDYPYRQGDIKSASSTREEKAITIYLPLKGGNSCVHSFSRSGSN